MTVIVDPVPDQFARHARTSEDDWGPAPSRSALDRAAARADPEPAKRPPGHKDTRHWCRGKEGREHQPLIAEGHTAVRRKGCGWAAPWYDRDGKYPVYWACHHYEVCGHCGRVLRRRRDLRDDECPAYPGTAEDRAAAEAKARELAERYRAWMPRRRKPPITGPQGYRRKRPA